MLNAQLKVVYERKLNKFRDRHEKAAGDILAHLSRLQRTYIVDCHNDPAEMWATIKAFHVQQVPSMCFSTYNNLFSIVKGPECHGRLRSTTSRRPLQTLMQGREGLGRVKSSPRTR
jgi:hypothetical protein